MVAPGGGETDDPNLVAGVDYVVEIILVQLDNIAINVLVWQV